jgi:mRNA interferase HicA
MLTTQHNRTVAFYDPLMTSQEFKRWLQRQGCTFDPGHGGHLIVRRGSRFSVLPITASRKSSAPAWSIASRRTLG